MSDVNELNVQTGVMETRAYNSEELIQRELEIDSMPELEKISAVVDQTKISALNKLKALGLTEEEAKSIAGIS